MPPDTISPTPGTPEYAEWVRAMWNEWERRQKEREPKVFNPVRPPKFPPRKVCDEDDGGWCERIGGVPPKKPGGCYTCTYWCVGTSYFNGGGQQLGPVTRFTKGGCDAFVKVVRGFRKESDCEASDPSAEPPVEGLGPGDSLWDWVFGGDPTGGSSTW